MAINDPHATFAPVLLISASW